ACNPGFGDCDGNPANGCETNLKTSPGNCGSCGSACNVTNAVASCVAGVCRIRAFVAPLAGCDRHPPPGREINLDTSTTHCGGCSTVCNSHNGTATCGSGTCGILCNAGYKDCDGLSANGCETNVASDVNNCNTCGHVCSATGGTPNCVNGSC